MVNFVEKIKKLRKEKMEDKQKQKKTIKYKEAPQRIEKTLAE